MNSTPSKSVGPPLSVSAKSKSKVPSADEYTLLKEPDAASPSGDAIGAGVGLIEETRGARTSFGSNVSSLLDKFAVADHDVLPETPFDSYHRLERTKKTCFDSLKGIFCMLIVAVVTSFHPTVFHYVFKVRNCKYSKSNYLSWSFGMYFGINMIPASILLCVNKDTLKPFKDDKKLIPIYMIRGMAGSTFLLLTTMAIASFGKPAPVSVIYAMAPIFVHICAYFVLKEKLGIVPVVNAFVAIGGVLIMNFEELKNPSKGKDALIGSAYGFTAMIVISCATVLVRLLRGLNPIIVNLSFGTFGTALMVIVAASTGTLQIMDDPVVWGFCFLSACISTISNFFFNLALRYEQAGVASLVKTSDVIFNFIYQMAFFRIPPTIYDGIGAFIVLFGVVCVTTRKIVNDSAEDSKLRKHLWFLLK